VGGGEVHSDHALWFPGRARGKPAHHYLEHAEASREFPSTLLIDTRTEARRRDQGELPGAIVIYRTVVSRVDRRGAMRSDEPADVRI